MDRNERPRVVQVRVLWGETAVLVRHLQPGQGFSLGAEAGPGVDFVVGADDLGCAHVAIVRGQDGRSLLVEALEGAETVRPLGEDERVARRFGELTVEVESVSALPAKDAIFPRKLRLTALAFVGISALIHGGLLACSSSAPPGSQASVDDGPTEDQVLMMQQYLASAAEKEMEEAEQEASSSPDQKEGGTGTRAKGEEGSMGSPSAYATGNRYGVQGPSDNPDPYIARQQAARDAAEFGMIGLLNSGSGGDPNAPVAPWGRDDSLGADPLSARGNLWGSEIDQGGAFGFSAVGEGGGGRGEGIGLGSIGTIGHGAGTGTAQGFGSGHGRLGGSHRVMPSSPGAAPPPRAEPVVAPVVEEAPIDPNGRFATTYRPGGGHLAAFDAAVAQGLLPAATREVVADVGGRFFPQVNLAEGAALGLRTDLERVRVAPAGGSVHVRLSLRGTDVAPDAKPHLSVHLVMDTSGSMEGESISRAREAALSLVERLGPTDELSLVTFSSEANLLVPAGPVGPRRGFITAKIREIAASGGTNIGEGLALGYAQAARSLSRDGVRVVMLLSDGQATEGETRPAALSQIALNAFQDGIPTSTFGIGANYDGPLMSSIASDGAGGYYYLADTRRIGEALATELDRRIDPIATAVEVRIRLDDGVDLLKVYGSRRLGQDEAARVRVQEVAADVQAARRDGIKQNREHDVEGGMRFFIPAFARGDSHALLLKLRLPPGSETRKIATIELKYKDRVYGHNVMEERPLRVDYASSDADSALSADASVVGTVQAFIAGESLLDAARFVSRGNVDAATSLLQEREEILRAASTQLAEPRLGDEATRLAKLRGHLGGSGHERLALAMMLESAGRSSLQ